MKLKSLHIKAIYHLLEKHKGAGITISEGAEKVIRIDATGDSQMDGEYIEGSLFIIDGKIYKKVEEDWETKKQ